MDTPTPNITPELASEIRAELAAINWPDFHALTASKIEPQVEAYRRARISSREKLATRCLD